MNVSAASSFAYDSYQELLRRRQETGLDAIDALSSGYGAMVAGADAVQTQALQERPDTEPGWDAEVQGLAESGMDAIGGRPPASTAADMLRLLGTDTMAVSGISGERGEPGEGLYAGAMRDLASRGHETSDFVNAMLSRIHTAYGSVPTTE